MKSTFVPMSLTDLKEDSKIISTDLGSNPSNCFLSVSMPHKIQGQKVAVFKDRGKVIPPELMENQNK